MSGNRKMFWIVPAVLIASWLAVRSLAALPAPERDGQLGEPQPPLALVGRAIVDPSLARFIGRLAAEARARN